MAQYRFLAVWIGCWWGRKCQHEPAPAKAPPDYLLYFPSESPKDIENWLLDLLLQGHEFKADRASLALQEVGLPYDFRELVMEHVGFYEAPKRMQAFRELLTPDGDSASLRLKMMAVLAKTEPDIDTLLLSFLAKDSSDSLFDPVEECLGQGPMDSGVNWRAHPCWL